MAPKVWQTQDLKKKDGSTVKVRYQDLPAARMDEAIKFFTDEMLKDDVFLKAAGVPKNEEAIKEYRSMNQTIFKEDSPQVVMCCIDDGSENGGQIIGVTVMMLSKSTDSTEDYAKHFPVKTKEMKNLFNVWTFLDKLTTDNESYTYYSGYGSIVAPEYCGSEVFHELMKLRSQVCKENKVSGTGEWMITKEDQQVAEKNNWVVAAETKPGDISAQCNVAFEDNSAVFKFMYVEV